MNIRYWTSGSDAEVEGQWVWTSTGQPLAFFNWYPGAPNNGYDDEDYLYIGFGGSPQWNDLRPATAYSSICEMWPCCPRHAPPPPSASAASLYQNFLRCIERNKSKLWIARIVESIPEISRLSSQFSIDVRSLRKAERNFCLTPSLQQQTNNKSPEKMKKLLCQLQSIKNRLPRFWKETGGTIIFFIFLLLSTGFSSSWCSISFSLPISLLLLCFLFFNWEPV